MEIGTLYGVGVGPGNPELITVKAMRIIESCPNLFVPKARLKGESVALHIVRRYVSERTNVRELVFPMVTDKAELDKKWKESASEISQTLQSGQDACFVTLGDCLLYSTYIYLLRAIKKILPDVDVVTVPGVNAFSHVAALTNFPVGEAKRTVTIVPTSDDLDIVRGAVSGGGTVILMKVGKRLENVLNTLEEMDAIEGSVFVSNAGMRNERIETDLRNLRGSGEKAGYMSTILVRSRGGRK